MQAHRHARSSGYRLDDWLLGLRRRQVLEQLGDRGEEGVHPRELADQLGSTRQHIREILRVLEAAGAVERVGTRYRLRDGNPLAKALTLLLKEAGPRRGGLADLPPSRH